LERLKVWIMTSPYRQHSLRHFWKQKQYNTLYQGFSASWPKQVVSWVVFLWADYALRQYWANTPGLPGEPLIIIPLLVGVVNTLAILPLGAIKTHMQCYQTDLSRSWKATLYMIASQYGWRGFYVGLGAFIAIQYSSLMDNAHLAHTYSSH
jgi:SNF family Na+-dependent transporter